MTPVTCRLTAKNRDQLRSGTIRSVTLPLLFFLDDRHVSWLDDSCIYAELVFEWSNSEGSEKRVCPDTAALNDERRDAVNHSSSASLLLNAPYVTTSTTASHCTVVWTSRVVQPVGHGGPHSFHPSRGGPGQWRRQDFVTGGGVRYGSIGGLEYEVPQKLTHLLQCTHILHNFWTSTHRGGASPLSPSLAAPLTHFLGVSSTVYTSGKVTSRSPCHDTIAILDA